MGSINDVFLNHILLKHLAGQIEVCSFYVIQALNENTVGLIITVVQECMLNWLVWLTLGYIKGSRHPFKVMILIRFTAQILL